MIVTTLQRWWIGSRPSARCAGSCRCADPDRARGGNFFSGRCVGGKKQGAGSTCSRESQEGRREGQRGRTRASGCQRRRALTGCRPSSQEGSCFSLRWGAALRWFLSQTTPPVAAPGGRRTRVPGCPWVPALRSRTFDAQVWILEQGDSRIHRLVHPFLSEGTMCSTARPRVGGVRGCDSSSVPALPWGCLHRTARHLVVHPGPWTADGVA